jgi:hypothetical protein
MAQHRRRLQDNRPDSACTAPRPLAAPCCAADQLAAQPPALTRWLPPPAPCAAAGMCPAGTTHWSWASGRARAATGSPRPRRSFRRPTPPATSTAPQREQVRRARGRLLGRAGPGAAEGAAGGGGCRCPLLLHDPGSAQLPPLRRRRVLHPGLPGRRPVLRAAAVGQHPIWPRLCQRPQLPRRRIRPAAGWALRPASRLACRARCKAAPPAAACRSRARPCRQLFLRRCPSTNPCSPGSPCSPQGPSRCWATTKA